MDDLVSSLLDDSLLKTDSLAPQPLLFGFTLNCRDIQKILRVNEIIGIENPKTPLKFYGFIWKLKLCKQTNKVKFIMYPNEISNYDRSNKLMSVNHSISIKLSLYLKFDNEIYGNTTPANYNLISPSHTQPLPTNIYQNQSHTLSIPMIDIETLNNYLKCNRLDIIFSVFSIVPITNNKSNNKSNNSLITNNKSNNSLITNNKSNKSLISNNSLLLNNKMIKPNKSLYLNNKMIKLTNRNSKYCGIPNQSSTCFLNSIIQTIQSIPQLFQV